MPSCKAAPGLRSESRADLRRSRMAIPRASRPEDPLGAPVHLLPPPQAQGRCGVIEDHELQRWVCDAKRTATRPPNEPPQIAARSIPFSVNALPTCAA